MSAERGERFSVRLGSGIACQPTRHDEQECSDDEGRRGGLLRVRAGKGRVKSDVTHSKLPRRRFIARYCSYDRLGIFFPSTGRDE